MSTDSTEQTPSPFTRPGFIAAALVVALVVVLGIVLAVVNATSDDPPTATTGPSTSATAPSEPTPANSAASICGLKGERLEGDLLSAPPTDWAYQDTTAYPTSSVFGPGETSPDGVRFCFQRSPEGALFAAANAVVQGSDPAVASAWLAYFLSADAPSRDQLLSAVASGTSASTRMRVSGFRLLDYDGASARVDVAVEGVGGGNTAVASAVYDLVWEQGDWKLRPQDPANPLRLAQIPNTSGYIAWVEQAGG